MFGQIFSIGATLFSQYAFIATLDWIIISAIRRLYFHPLAHIPGPKLDAASMLYQTYYCFSGGRSRFYQKIAQLHDKYGDSPSIASQDDRLELLKIEIQGPWFA